MSNGMWWLQVQTTMQKYLRKFSKEVLAQFQTDLWLAVKSDCFQYRYNFDVKKQNVLGEEPFLTGSVLSSCFVPM